MSSEGMEEISKLESRLRDALDVIDAAVGEGEGLADIAELRLKNAELKSRVAAAEQAANEARARLAETSAELQSAMHLSRAVADTGDVVESITRVHSGLDGQLQVIQSRLDEALGKISDLANQVQDCVRPANDPLNGDGSRTAQSEVEAEVERLRQIRRDDVDHINGILERLIPLVEGGRGA